jgi:hypothetical protein
VKPSDVPFDVPDITNPVLRAYTAAMDRAINDPVHVNQFGPHYHGWPPFRDGVKVGLAIAERENRWIPVTERMPPENESVMCWVPGQKNVVTRLWTGSKWEMHRMPGREPHIAATHWRKLTGPTDETH